MLSKKKKRFWKASMTMIAKNLEKRLSIIILITLFMMTGCSHIKEKSSELEISADTVETEYKTNILEESRYSEEEIKAAENIAAAYQDIYEEALEKNKADSPEAICRIVNRLGENGYSAVDIEKQLDMVCPEKIKKFCSQVEAQKEVEASLIVVVSAIRFVKYKFTTKDGEVEVSYNYYLYQGDDWEIVGAKKYPAYTWVYSEEGYLFFEEYHMPGFDGPSGHTAFRHL